MTTKPDGGLFELAYVKIPPSLLFYSKHTFVSSGAAVRSDGSGEKKLKVQFQVVECEHSGRTQRSEMKFKEKGLCSMNVSEKNQLKVVRVILETLTGHLKHEYLYLSKDSKVGLVSFVITIFFSV